MPPYLLLAIAIAGEVAATTSLKLSENFSKLVPSIVVVVGYLVAFGVLGKLLKDGFPVGVAYAIWAAAGIAAVAAIGAVFFAEPVNWTMAGGLLLIIGGVVMLELGRAH
ncbi:QacE family quaternary ammonium compound efflux SMR transporter [Kibdelosporangium aridum]|uniref:QacE family quaternary ammonium compound efflux SMR transporter n=1 Tax=Kibdelosporangium aridum TaxID=2030 RepID=A0A428YJ13_KIBAR|nr:SMR family transporter [Kibdelosporangium aridum]RSM67584.1 QacE family quaternary ammonium compound efflux SMR transporter [Kibdelosporangium aridum]